MSALIHALVLDGQGGVSKELTNKEQISAWQSSDGLLWLHLDYCFDEAQDYLDGVNLSDFAYQSLLAEETRPRMVSEGQGTLMFLRGVNLNPAQTPDDMVSIRLYVSERLIVSTRHRRLLSVSALADTLRAGKGPKDASSLICQLSENLTSRMQDVIDELEDKLDQFEEQVDSAKPHDHNALSQVRRQTIGLKRYIRPQKDALRGLLSQQPSWLQDDDCSRLSETINHLVRYLEELDMNIERAQIIQQEVSSQVSDQLNKRMYVMSVVAALFLPLGFLTGLLGVNIGGIPGTESDAAFAIFVIALVALTALIAVYFKLKKWL
ncbi:zinc transporter ZntB [Pseudoalteromonas sp. T1lg75]|uniref:zinc transporter ZntB n=1 Tax=Pseudoalteromonas sp. T1lg75 TaxID=2077102 RepID=UPI000CF64F69|nr:zinc transporter ZntB [Pseudoalteromonas sp. T1lg75]